MIKNVMKQYLENHSRLNLLQYILRKKIWSEKACKEYLEIETDPFVVKYHHFGDLNIGKTIYLIDTVRLMPGNGWCSLLMSTLFHLAYAERMNFEPYVDWSGGSPYGEEFIVNETYNPFEYFFKQVSEYDLETVKKSDLVVCAKNGDRHSYYYNENQGYGYCIDKSNISLLAEMSRKYLKFNDFGIKEIENEVVRVIGMRRCLGVHVRGTDFLNNYDKHPVLVSVDEYINKVRHLLENNCYDFVFVATDQESIKQKFINEFHEKVLYNDVLRSKNGDALHYGKRTKRLCGNYLLGKEVALDMYTLASCDGIVAGLSNVSTMARVIRLSRGIEYKDEIIISNGINNNTHRYKHK